MKRRVFLFFVPVIAGCMHQKPDMPAVCTGDISYKKQVQQIFISSCTMTGCHDGVDMPSMDRFDVAHDAAAQIEMAVSSGVMPQNGHLSAAEKQVIICWVKAGAKNN